MTHQKANHDESLAKLAKLIHGIDFCMLTTLMPDGSLRSRPMSTQKAEFDGELWFLTEYDSAKTDEINREHQVNVAYADPDSQTYVSVSGVAHCFRDRKKAEELWSPFHRAWFPKGLDDPNLAVLRVHVNYAEYWDSSSSAIIHLVGVVKATLTGKAYNPGENEKLTLDAQPGESRSHSSSSQSAPAMDQPTKPHGDPLAAAAGIDGGPIHQGSRHGEK